MTFSLKENQGRKVFETGVGKMNLLLKPILFIQGISFGKGLRSKGLPVVVKAKGSEIIIGRNCTIKSAFLSNFVGLYQRSVIVARAAGAVIRIGDHVGMSGATIYARNKIEIGDHTQIGGNVKILDNDFHPLEAKARREDIKEEIRSAPISIGKDCFIGVNAIILKGTVLGDRCVVGAGAVVSGSFPEGSVIAGNPAKVIKTI